MKSAIHFLLRFVVVLSALTSTTSIWAQQQIAFTVSAAFLETKLGYTTGHPFSLTMVMNDPAPLAFGGSFSSDASGFGSVAWTDGSLQAPSPPPIWNSLSGTGITGSYIPAGIPNSNQNFVTFGSYQSIGQLPTDVRLRLKENGISGMQANGLDLTDIVVNVQLSGLAISLPLSMPSPYDLLSGHLGYYNNLSQEINYVSANGESVFFHVWGVNISAVPEPPVTALGLAGGLLLVAVIRRKRRLTAA